MQMKFAHLLVSNECRMTGYECAKEAGYSEDRARVTASELQSPKKYPLVVKESENKFVDRSFNYIFEPVKQGIYLNTKLDALYSIYKDGNHQEYIGFGAGPEFVFGEFKK